MPAVLVMLFLLLNPVNTLAESTEELASIASPNIQAASSAPNVSREKALEIFKNTFPSQTSGRTFESEFEDRDGKMYWRFQPGDQTYESVYCNIDANSGEVMSFDFDRRTQVEIESAQKILNKEDCMKLAIDFAEKLQPDKLSHMILDEHPAISYSPAGIETVCSFQWVREENGIKVSWDRIGVGVNRLNGEIVYYNYKWHDCIFPAPGKIIPADQLWGNILTNAGLYPCYEIPWEALENEVIKPLMPVYCLNSSQTNFDPETGDPISWDGKKQSGPEVKMYLNKITPALTGASSTVDQSEKEPVSADLAMKNAKHFFGLLDIDGQIRKSGGGSSSGYFGQRTEHWNYSIVDCNETSVEVDKYSGKVISFTKEGFRGFPGQQKQKEKNISYEKAVQIAREFIRKANPAESKELILIHDQSIDIARSDYYIHFDRLINGIPFKTDGINVKIDPSNGEIIAYRIDWHSWPVSAYEALLTEKEAKDILRKNNCVHLAYIFPYDPESNKQSSQPILVYNISTSIVVNAVNGQVFDLRAKTSQTHANTRFEGHWAQAALILLADSKLLPESLEDPNSAINRRDILAVLVRSNRSETRSEIQLEFTDLNKDDPNLNIFKQAVSSGIIGNEGSLEPDNSLSREDLAAWIANMLGYKKIAAMPNKIETPCNDAKLISPEKVNAVGIANGLGLLTPDANGNIRPQDKCTWAELATIMPRLISHY